jgi:hypothetical protein
VTLPGFTWNKTKDPSFSAEKEAKRLFAGTSLAAARLIVGGGRHTMRA